MILAKTWKKTKEGDDPVHTINEMHSHDDPSGGDKCKKGGCQSLSILIDIENKLFYPDALSGGTGI
jgi:hypothetical protein